MVSLVSSIVLWMFFSSPLEAHDRTGLTTARLIQRQGNIELIIRTDLVRLLVLDLGQPGLDPREAALLEVLPEAELTARVEGLKSRIVGATHLRIGPVELKPERIVFPSADRIRLSAASFLESSHPDDSEIIFDSRMPTQGGDVSLAFDRFLGPVMVTYSQPETRLVAAGTRTTFRQEVPAIWTYGIIVLVILSSLVFFWLVRTKHKRLQAAEEFP